MSDALDYLLKARPEAMGHYFRFVSTAGKHLDPKTRALISVITQVQAPTEAGLRQYLRRALSVGCRPGEILDAMLMAFPALGLTRVVWAVDVILKMNLPEFDVEKIAKQPDWHNLGAAADFEIEETVRVQMGVRPVFVHRTAHEYRVYDARCPHRGTEIPADAISGRELICPEHGWIFDARGGRCISGGKVGLTRLPCKVEDGVLFAQQ